MMLQFTAGINTAGGRESVTVAAEDVLIAALKVKMRTNKPASRPLAIPLRTSENWRPSVAG
jgi:hypothetical protein